MSETQASAPAGTIDEIIEARLAVLRQQQAGMLNHPVVMMLREVAAQINELEQLKATLASPSKTASGKRTSSAKKAG